MSYSTQGVLGSSSIGGEWELVERWIPTTASTSYTFSGLNGDRDRRYKIKAKLYGAGTSYIFVKINNDSGTNQYVQRYIYGGPTDAVITSVQGNDGDSFIYASETENTKVSKMEMEIDCGSGMVRPFFIKSMCQKTTSNLTTFNMDGFWKNDVDNLTTIGLSTSTGTALIGVGSYVELWRLKQNNQISSGEWSLVERWEPTVASTSYTFSGLNGNRDRRYKVNVQYVPANGKTGIYMKINNDSTTNIYHTVFSQSGGSGDILQNVIDVANLNTDAIGCQEMQIWAKSGTYRKILAVKAAEPCGISSSAWKNTTDNITSLVFEGDTLGIGVGTCIELWKLNQ